MGKLKNIYMELEEQAIDKGFRNYEECVEAGYRAVYDNENPHWEMTRAMEEEIEEAREDWELDKIMRNNDKWVGKIMGQLDDILNEVREINKIMKGGQS